MMVYTNLLCLFAGYGWPIRVSASARLPRSFRKFCSRSPGISDGSVFYRPLISFPMCLCCICRKLRFTCTDNASASFRFRKPSATFRGLNPVKNLKNKFHRKGSTRTMNLERNSSQIFGHRGKNTWPSVVSEVMKLKRVYVAEPNF